MNDRFGELARTFHDAPGEACQGLPRAPQRARQLGVGRLQLRRQLRRPLARRPQRFAGALLQVLALHDLTARARQVRRGYVGARRSAPERGSLRGTPRERESPPEGARILSRLGENAALELSDFLGPVRPLERGRDLLNGLLGPRSSSPQPTAAGRGRRGARVR